MKEFVLEVEDEDLENVYADLRELVIFYLDMFFSGKKSKSGEAISPHLYRNEEVIDLIMNLSMSNGIDMIYSILKKKFKEKTTKGKLPADIDYTINILRHCARMGIPRNYAPGIIIMYLKLCEGLNFEL